MPRSVRRAGLRAGLSALLAATLVATPTATSYAATSTPSGGPDYEAPFPCGEYWSGVTRADHSPSPQAIDWNRPDDNGAIVVSPAPGVVTAVVNLGSRSYGRYIVVDHGDGHSTLFAHLAAQWVSVGQTVDQGTPLGQVGSSGGSTGPHLHLEERLNRTDVRPYFNRTWFKMGTTLESENCGNVPVVGNWDGNAGSNVGVMRRASSPAFYLKRPRRTPLTIPFGSPTDQPLSGDWNGDGTTDVGVFRPGTRQFLLRSSTGVTTSFRLGSVGDVAVTGDWEGDGRTNVAVWHPDSHLWTLRMADGSTRQITFGVLGGQPVAADWDGDGNTDLGIYSAGTSTFTLRTVSRSGVLTLRNVAYGTPSSLPVAGDWNGDGIGDVGVWDPASAQFSLRLSPTSRTAAVTRTRTWGVPRG